MPSWTGWPSTITDDCTRLWVTSVRCNMSTAGMRHSVNKLHKSGLTFMNLGDAPDDERNLRVEVLG
jgi:hypothetical protein